MVRLRIAVTARGRRTVLEIPDMGWFKVLDWNDARLDKVFPFLYDVGEGSLCFCLCGETISCPTEPPIRILGEARLRAVDGHGRHRSVDADHFCIYALRLGPYQVFRDFLASWIRTARDARWPILARFIG
jgi:hypothetical protein